MRRIAILLSLVVLAPSLAFASTLRPWVSVDGSWGTYAMSDVNDELSGLNAALAGTGLSIDEIHNGFGVGGRLGFDLESRFSIGVGYDRLFASTDVGDASGKLEYKLPANAFHVFGEYIPIAEGPMNLRLGAGVGAVSSSGSVELTDYANPVNSLQADLSGTGPLFEGHVAGDLWMAPQLALTGSAGFRYAKISTVKVQGTTIPDYSLDYSGLLLRLGLKVAFTR